MDFDFHGLKNLFEKKFVLIVSTGIRQDGLNIQIVVKLPQYLSLGRNAKMSAEHLQSMNWEQWYHPFVLYQSARSPAFISTLIFGNDVRNNSNRYTKHAD
jgi:hypothetical protein